MSKEYETVIGLEVHVELKTNTKIFCSCEVEFGENANTHICPVCLGLPGALPVLNERVVEFAIKAGLSTNCNITRYGKQDRKNYFYPDSAKAYQISQDDLPICHGGYLDINTQDGEKKINIERIHIEEDAGKLIHNEEFGTLIDFNRAGVPLIEIVTHPDFRNEEEVVSFLQKLRTIMIYTDVSDAKMNEGSFRCDVNLSIREKGEGKLGTRSEVKNLNSFNSIRRAIKFERERQVKEIELGRNIIQETRGYNDDTGTTYSMREKEEQADYRYFPDPDLMPIVIEEKTIKDIKNALPELPDARKNSYMEKYDLNSYDAEQIIISREVSDYFEESIKYTSSVKTLINILVSEIFSLSSPDDFYINISPQNLGELVNLLEDNIINNSSAKQVIKIMNQTGDSPKEIIKEKGLEQINDREELEELVDKALSTSERAILEYRSGKKKALQSIMGKIMKKTRGRANPELSKEILEEKLKVQD